MRSCAEAQSAAAGLKRCWAAAEAERCGPSTGRFHLLRAGEGGSSGASQMRTREDTENEPVTSGVQEHLILKRRDGPAAFQTTLICTLITRMLLQQKYRVFTAIATDPRRSTQLHPPWRGRACQSWRWTSRRSCRVALSAAQSRSCAGRSTAWGRWRMPRHHLSGSPDLYLPCLLRGGGGQTRNNRAFTGANPGKVLLQQTTKTLWMPETSSSLDGKIGRGCRWKGWPRAGSCRLWLRALKAAQRLN